jgi:hypothetical protein
MIQMFRRVKDCEAGFYEFMRFEGAEGGVAHKLRHFPPGLVGWEEEASGQVVVGLGREWLR